MIGQKHSAWPEYNLSLAQILWALIIICNTELGIYYLYIATEITQAIYYYYYLPKWPFMISNIRLDQ